MRLLDKLAEKHFADLDPKLRTNILAYFADFKVPAANKDKKDRNKKKEQKDWQKAMEQLNQLKATTEKATERPRASDDQLVIVADLVHGCTGGSADV